MGSARWVHPHMRVGGHAAGSLFCCRVDGLPVWELTLVRPYLQDTLVQQVNSFAQFATGLLTIVDTPSGAGPAAGAQQQQLAAKSKQGSQPGARPSAARSSSSSSSAVLDVAGPGAAEVAGHLVLQQQHKPGLAEEQWTSACAIMSAGREYMAMVSSPPCWQPQTAVSLLLLPPASSCICPVCTRAALPHPSSPLRLCCYAPLLQMKMAGDVEDLLIKLSLCFSWVKEEAQQASVWVKEAAQEASAWVKEAAQQASDQARQASSQGAPAVSAAWCAACASCGCHQPAWITAGVAHCRNSGQSRSLASPTQPAAERAAWARGHCPAAGAVWCCPAAAHAAGGSGPRHRAGAAPYHRS